MRHPDGTPHTAAEWIAERAQRWAWLGEHQRSTHAYSARTLPFARRYCEGEYETFEAMLEAMRRHFAQGRFPLEPMSAMSPADLNALGRGAYQHPPPSPPGPPDPALEAEQAWWAALIERERAESENDPLIGQWVRFTAVEGPDEEEDRDNGRVRHWGAPRAATGRRRSPPPLLNIGPGRWRRTCRAATNPMKWLI